MGMIRQEYHYVVCGFALSELNLASYIHSGVTVSGFEIIEDNDAKETIRGIFEDLRISDSSDDDQRTSSLESPLRVSVSSTDRFRTKQLPISYSNLSDHL